MLIKNFIIEGSEDYKLRSTLNWMQCLGEGLTGLMNCEAHWLLAYYYYKLAVDMPNVLAEKQP